MNKPIRLLFFHDVLCAYCAVTAQRLRALALESSERLEIELRPFPLRAQERVLDARELRRVVRHTRLASREPEGAGITPAIWTGRDLPWSSVPPLVALEAARAQGVKAQAALAERLRIAAFHGGLNVTRRDVIFEAAASLGLDLRQFGLAFDSREAAAAVEASHRDALGRGVQAVPSIVIEDEWMLTGVREVEEYRSSIERWLEEREGVRGLRTLH